MNQTTLRDEEILAAAVALPPVERRGIVESRCGHDPVAIDRVMALLRGYENNGACLEASPLASGNARNGRQLPLELAPGDAIGRYRLAERIGEGGFGVVWLAEQTEPMKRSVAIKVMRLGLDTSEFIARFEAERQALALMNHPSIARVFDAGATESGRPYLVMELISGVPLVRYCDDHRLMIAKRLELFIQVCSAIQHAHQKGVIHRDLKPSNILVALEGGRPVPKVIDFGIAKAMREPLTDKALATHRHAVIGTPTCISPEQLELSGLDVDTRADIYSLGVLLYELLAGRQPFDHETLERSSLEEMRRLIREVSPPRPSARVSALHAEECAHIARQRSIDPALLPALLCSELDWVVMRCLEKDRARRYETADALALDVQRHLRNEPVVARPPSRVYQLRKFVRRHRTGALAGAAVVISLVSGLITSSVLLMRAREAERAESLLRHEAEQARTTEAIRASRVAMDPASQWLAQGRAAEGLAYLVYAARIDPKNPAIAPRLASFLTSWNFLLPEGPVAQHSAPVLAVDYSNDGSRLIMLWNDGTYGSLDLVTGQLERNRMPSPAVSGYGRMSTPNTFVVYCPDGVIRTINRRTGKVAHEFGFNVTPLGCGGVLSTDLFVTKHADSTMSLADARNGRMLGSPVSYSAYLITGERWMIWSADGKVPTHRLRLRSTTEPENEFGLTLPLPVNRNRLAPSPDGETLAVVQPDETGALRLHVWSLPQGNLLARSVPLPVWGHLFYSPDGRRILHWTNGIDAFDAKSAARVAQMPAAGSAYSDEDRFTFSPDGRTLVTWTTGAMVEVWNLETGAHVQSLSHGGNVQKAIFSSDSRVLLTSSDGLVRVWRADTGELLAAPTLRLRGVPVVALSPSGTQVAIGSSEGAVHHFRLGAGGAKPIGWSRNSELPAFFLPRSPTRLVAMGPSNARVIEPSARHAIGTELGYPEAITRVRLRDDGRVFVVRTRNGRWAAWWWDEHTIQRDVTLRGAPADDAGIAFSPAGSRVFLGGPRFAQVWDLRTGEPVGPRLPAATLPIAAQAASFSPDGRRLVLNSDGGYARVWDVEGGKAVNDFGPNRLALPVFNHDGTRIAAGNRSGEVLLVEGDTGALPRALGHHGGLWSRALFSPDGNWLVSFARDGLLRFWDGRSGLPAGDVLESSGSFQSVHFTADSRRLVTASNDGVAQVWDVDSRLPVTEVMKNVQTRISRADFSPDGRFVLTWPYGSALFYLWSVPPALPPNTAAPGWLLDLATIYAGKRLGDDGRFVDAEINDGIDQVRRQLGALPDDAPYVEWGRWILADRGTRSIAPGFAITPTQAEKLAKELSGNVLP